MTSYLRNWLVPTLLVAAVLWAYWIVLGDMAERRVDDPQYSHGYLVPVFAVYLLWSRRQLIRGTRPTPSWWGVAILLAGLSIWGLGTYFFLNWLAAISLLGAAAGLAVTWGGWRRPLVVASRAVSWVYGAASLSVTDGAGGGLQRIATTMSTYALQTLGAPAISEGNLILLNNVKIGIVDACSGLGMMMTFFALSTAFAMLQRSAEWWLRLVIVASAVPVAVLANVARITITGLLYNAAQDHLARVVFHDIAGLLMMPLAVGVLFAELYVLKRLIIVRPGQTLKKGSVFWLPPTAATVPKPN